MREINLSMNGFYEDGCRALGDMLSVNSTIETIDITGNRIDKHSLDLFLKGCAQNRSLMTLRVTVILNV